MGIAPGLYYRILEFLIFFGQLPGNRSKALTDAAFIPILCILDHVIFIRMDDISLEQKDFLKIVPFYKALDDSRHCRRVTGRRTTVMAA